MNLGGQAAIELEAIGRVSNVKFRFGERLAAIAHFEFREFLRLTADRFSDFEQELAAVERGGFSPWPTIEGFASSLNGGDHVFATRFRDFGN